MNIRQNKATRRRWNPLRAAAAIVLLGWVAGCGRKAPDYVPSSKAARQALDAALTAWVDGKPVGLVDTASPPVQVVDKAWWKRQRLASYEILGEEPGRDGLCCFTVRLHKSKPSGEETVRYLVTGRSPLWVYREEDYKSSQSWEGYK